MINLPGVALQIAQLGECLSATRMGTLVWLLSSVGTHVLLKVTQLRELAFTDLAFVRFYACMNSRVLREITAVRKALLAGRAFVGFGVLLMDVLGVNQQVRL